jgi:hypothetical protein
MLFNLMWALKKYCSQHMPRELMIQITHQIFFYSFCFILANGQIFCGFFYLPTVFSYSRSSHNSLFFKFNSNDLGILFVSILFTWLFMLNLYTSLFRSSTHLQFCLVSFSYKFYHYSLGTILTLFCQQSGIIIPI